jgi:hydroxyacylglutathione hydrolase
MIQFQKRDLTVFQSALYQTTTAIIQTEEAIILTDPNWLPSEVKMIQQFINDNIGSRQLYIIFTHSDFDHIIAAGAFPNAITIASKVFVDRADKEKVLNEIRRFDAQYYIKRDYPIVYPEINVVVEHDGWTLSIGDCQLVFYLAPGHTEDGLMTVVKPFGILLAGDYLSDVEFPFIADVEAYENTLNKAKQIVEKHNITTLIPGHGQTTDEEQSIYNRIEESSDYIMNLKSHIDQQQELKTRYPFYDGLQEMHEANRKLITK